MSPVLVTGGSGYVGTQLIAALLRDGTEVRTTVRSLDREAELRKAVRRGGADDAGLEVVVADLMADGGWARCREMSCSIWSSTTTAPATSSAGGRVPPRPRSWKPRKACGTSDCWGGSHDPGRNRPDHRPCAQIAGDKRLSVFGDITICQ